MIVKKLMRACSAFFRLWLLVWGYLVACLWRWMLLFLGRGSSVTPVPEQKDRAQTPVARGLLADVGVETKSKPKTRGKPRAKRSAHTGTFIASSFTNTSGQRDYKLFIPGGKKSQRSLVVMLHGCKQNPDDFAAGTRMNDWAHVHDCLVLYPGQSTGANGFGCWNWFNPKDRSREAGELSIIAGMVATVVAEHTIHPERVFVAGLSAGAAMAVNLASMYPELIRAVGVHSGLPFAVANDVMSAMVVMKHGSVTPPEWRDKRPDAMSNRPLAMIVFHGDQDEVVHPRNADALVAQALVSVDAEAAKPSPKSEATAATEDGLGYTRHVYAVDGSCLEYWQIHGAGHAWSGGSPDGSYTEPRGPDASKEMLRFFFDVDGQSLAARDNEEPAMLASAA